MSTFKGLIDEIPGISVDYFRGPENEASNLFFLSHCHTDHMEGLDTLLFNVVNNFSQREVFVYASEISVQILRNKYSGARRNDRLRFLSIGPQHILQNGDKDLCVTLVPAGHCPGSVMFLFEGEKTILYTGDIRVTKKDVENYKCFKMDSGSVKQVDKMYFDSTFFSEEYLNFPARERSIQDFINSVKYNLQKKDFTIFYQMPAKYGSEFLMIETFKELRIPFHVSQETYEIYKNIPEMDEIVTLNPRKTRLHTKVQRKRCCNWFFPNTYEIHTSCFRWKNDDYSNGIIEKQSGIDHICYSSHCSLQELKDIISYLKPKALYPCVIPKEPKEEAKLWTLIDNVLAEVHDENIEKEVNEPSCNTSWILETFEEPKPSPSKRSKVDPKITYKDRVEVRIETMSGTSEDLGQNCGGTNESLSGTKCFGESSGIRSTSLPEGLVKSKDNKKLGRESEAIGKFSGGSGKSCKNLRDTDDREDAGTKSWLLSEDLEEGDTKFGSSKNRGSKAGVFGESSGNNRNSRKNLVTTDNGDKKDSQAKSWLLP